MARQTFFSFHYERDAWRAGQVRNCNLLPTNDQHGFIDSVEWESIERQGDEAIKRWITNQLNYTSVTVVLIGAETANRPWVQHEITQSWNRGNGIVGVWIHNVKDREGKLGLAGPNPFEQFRLPDGILLSSICRTYDWAIDDGRNNLGKWSEEAVQARERYKDYEIPYAAEIRCTVENVNPFRSIPVRAGFTPRSPWCAIHAETGR